MLEARGATPLPVSAINEGLRSRRMLPIVDFARPVEVIGKPIGPSRFTSPNGDMSIDIYTNTLCHGSGTKGKDRHCAYCFLDKKDLTNDTMMSLASFDQILNWFTSDGIRTNEKGHPRKTVSLLGGEFALHPNAKEMIKRVHKKGLNVHIVTSGSDEFRELLQDEEVQTILRDENRDNLVAVSMDSIDEKINDKWRGEDATGKAKTTIAELRDLKIPFRINATVTNDAISGLPDLYDFAQEVGAQKVLVHFPSPVGMGEKFDDRPDSPSSQRRSIIPAENLENMSKAGWQYPVLDTTYFYNMFERKSDDFEVECQVGHMEASTCHMLENATSLQFAPPINDTNPDIPVVACGLTMSKAKTNSAYLFREGDLYQRAGQSEMTLAADGRRTSPLECPFSQGTGRACIYEVSNIPAERVTDRDPLRIVINQSAHNVYNMLLNPRSLPLFKDSLMPVTTDDDEIKLGTLYRQSGGSFARPRSYFVTQLSSNKRLGLRSVETDHQVLYKIMPIDANKVELVIYEWADSGEILRTHTQRHLRKLQ